MHYKHRKSIEMNIALSSQRKAMVVLKGQFQLGEPIITTHAEFFYRFEGEI
jgi:hypothetical protein